MSLMNSVKSLFNRQEFAGRNDKYLDEALSGMGVYDVLGMYFTEHLRDQTQIRLQRYRKNWQFYRGDHFSQASDDGARKLVINLMKPIVNKSVDWLFAQGWDVVTPPGNEAFGPLLEKIWKMNNKHKLSWEIGQMGGITGDAMIQVSVNDIGPDGQPLPLANQKIVIRNVNPAYCHPVYDPFDSDDMIACLIQYPVRTNDIKGIPTAAINQRPMSLYTQYITKTEITEFYNNQQIRKYPNMFGKVNVVHIKNIPVAGGYFGASDIDDAIPLNEELNLVAGSIGEIISYHAAPTTLLFGARAQQLEKGVKKIWGNLPVNSRVENLKLEGDLAASTAHMETIKLAIHELTSTPEASLGKQQEISNTSNQALETQYMPLIEKTHRKYITYGLGIAKVNELILMLMDIRFKANLQQYAGDKLNLYSTEVHFASPLPADKKEQLENLKMRVDNGWESNFGALKELGVKDLQRKAVEITADQRQKLAEETERAKSAIDGSQPNLAVFGLGSLTVGTGIQDVFKGQDQTLNKKSAELTEINSQIEELTASRDELVASIEGIVDLAAEAEAAQNSPEAPVPAGQQQGKKPGGFPPKKGGATPPKR